MATKYTNLSQYNAETMPDNGVVENQCYAIAVADWNPQITHSMLKGAIETLELIGVKRDNITVVHVPGTIELTYASKVLQNQHKYDAIIAIGCVIKGETSHFDYVCSSVTQGITSLNLRDASCPVIFGVLTTNNPEQALDRAGGKYGNKGIEAATTAIKMVNCFK